MKFYKQNENYIYIPSQVLCQIKKNYIWFSGNFGTWFHKIPSGCIIIKTKNIVLFKQLNLNVFSSYYNIKSKNTFWNLRKQLAFLQYLIIATCCGFKRFLKIRGVGYKWFFNPITKQIEVDAGLSHKFQMKTWSKLKYKITFKGKQISFRLKSLITLSQILFVLRNKRVPNYITGQGIRYLKDKAQKRVRIDRKK